MGAELRGAPLSWKNLVFTVTPGVLYYQAVTCHPLWRGQAKRLVELLPEVKRDVRVLDLGCGAGASTFTLADRLGDDARIVGLDVSPAMLAEAERGLRKEFSHLGGRVRFVQGDAEALPFEDGSFDVVAGHSFLYLCRAPDAVLREIHRVLAPGGSLVLMEPAREGSLLRMLVPGLRDAEIARSTPLTALRMVVAVVGWRLLAAVVGTISRPATTGWLDAAGYRSVRFEPTLAGLAWHVRAER